MGIIRNFIDIIGITPENELPDRIDGQIVEYSEVENIFIPEHRPRVRNIFQIIVQVEIKSKRVINAPLGRIIVLDGVKKLKLLYEERNDSRKANIINLEIPYNTFFELEKGVEDVENIEVHILDAYFHMMDSYRIYSHLVYLLHVHYSKEKNFNGDYVITLGEDGKQTIEAATLVMSGKAAMDEALMTEDNMVTFKRTNNFHRGAPRDVEARLFIDLDSEYL